MSKNSIVDFLVIEGLEYTQVYTNDGCVVKGGKTFWIIRAL